MNAEHPHGNSNGDLIAKYDSYSHEQLYGFLNSGNPEQIDALAGEWKKILQGCHDVHQNLTGELTKLGGSWASGSGHEFQRRMGLVAAFADDLASNMANFHTTLTGLSGTLREAQKKNEHPEATDDHDATVNDAFNGAALAGPVGGVVGAYMGHNKDKAEKKAAKNRVVQLIAGLSGDYQGAAATWVVPTEALSEMPGEDVHDSGVVAGSVDSGPGTSAAPASNPLARHENKDGRFDVHPPQVPGTELAGAVPAGVITADGGSGTELAGAGGGPSGAAGFRGGLSTGGAGSLGSGLASAPGGAGVGLTGGMVGAPASSASGSGPARTGRGAGAGRRGGEGESDEYTTWLTEDDMVWGDDDRAGPDVIGD